MSILIKNIRAVDPSMGLDKITDIYAEGSTITEIGTIDKPADKVIDGTGLVAFPGLFDMHVHLRDPGLTHKEDIITGTNAAKAGGFTAIACMPNTKPVIDNAETVEYILSKAKKSGIRVYPVGCVTKGMKSKELTDFGILKKAGNFGLLVLSHCEDLNIINGGIINKGEVSEKLGVKGMDRASEDYITAREIALAMSSNSPVHICHVSTKGSVDIIRAAKKDGVKVTCETAPHYFTYTDEKLLSRDADYRMSPPLRTEQDRLAIQGAILDGTIDCIITDHAPHTAEEKADFEKAPNGVVGLETSLAMTLTRLYHTGLADLSKIAEIMSINPRKILGLEPIKIAAGSELNLAIFDPEYEWEVIPEELNSKSKNTVFKGERCKGKVLYTICDGKIVFQL